MKKISLTGKRAKGLYAIVDDEDFEFLSQFKWCLNGYRYPITGIRKGEKWTTISLHRLLFNDRGYKQIDHINRDKLDNRKINLRGCTVQQNNLNRGLFKSSTSGYKGAYYDKTNKKWHSRITLNYKPIHLGYFATPELAHEAYVNKFKELHGEMPIA